MVTEQLYRRKIFCGCFRFIWKGALNDAHCSCIIPPHEKSWTFFFFKKQQFSLKILATLNYVNFFLFSLFSKVILLICSNITMLYLTVHEIWSIIYITVIFRLVIVLFLYHTANLDKSDHVNWLRVNHKFICSKISRLEQEKQK